MKRENSCPGHRNTLHLLCYSLFFLLLFSSCLKEKFCPGFDAGDFEEFSYSGSDTLTFESETSDIFQVFISEIIMSEAYTYECRDLYKICPCINSIEAVAKDSRNDSAYSFLRMEQSDVSEMQYFKYNVQGFMFEFDFINELPHINEMDHLKYFKTLLIGNTVYNDVVLITNSETEVSDIYQVYFNKKNGLLKFSERSTSKVWSLKN